MPVPIVAGVAARFLASRYAPMAMNLLKEFAKDLVISTVISTTLGFGGVAQAHNEVPVKGDIETRATALSNLTNRVAGGGNAAAQLYETAIHESGGLKYNRQMITKKIEGKTRLVPEGVARSIFMVEPTTAKNLVRWSADHPKAMDLLVRESGRTAKELGGMSKLELANLMMEHDHFAAAMARVKYLSSPGKIPGTLEERASYWSKFYQGTNNKIKRQQYLNDVRGFEESLRAYKLEKVMKKHVVQTTNTVGLTNKALHESKTMSKVGTASSKAIEFLKKIIKR